MESVHGRHSHWSGDLFEKLPGALSRGEPTSPHYLDTAMLGFVLSVEMNDHARQSFDNIGVGSRACVNSPRADPADNPHDFLLRFFVVAAHQDIAERRIDIAEIYGGNIVQSADEDRKSVV